ncbi:MAG: Carbohydrate binding family 6 [Dactylosporangium sp.]|nr:Carbohydrate binding family 6 [Dactylosporangium sp.]
MTAVAGVLVVATMGVGVVQAASPRRGGQSLLLPASGPTTTGDVTTTFTPELGGRPDASIGTYPTPDASVAPQPATATTADSPRPAQPPAPATPLPATPLPAAPPPASARRPAAPAVMSVVAYEAEDPANSRSAGTWLRAVRGTSGGYVIGYVGKGRSLRMTGVNVPAAGRYALTIYYIAGDPRAGTLLINGRVARSSRFPLTPDWYTVGSVTVPVNLASGGNTIEIGNEQGYAPDIDRIVVR